MMMTTTTLSEKDQQFLDFLKGRSVTVLIERLGPCQFHVEIKALGGYNNDPSFVHPCCKTEQHALNYANQVVKRLDLKVYFIDNKAPAQQEAIENRDWYRYSQIDPNNCTRSIFRIFCWMSETNCWIAPAQIKLEIDYLFTSIQVAKALEQLEHLGVLLKKETASKHMRMRFTHIQYCLSAYGKQLYQKDFEKNCR